MGDANDLDLDLDLGRRLKEQAIALGFDRVGIAAARAAPDYDHFRRWLDAGAGASMSYLAEQAEARAHPEGVLPGVRSVLMASLVYGGPPSRTAVGKVARYARGDDYHTILRARLERLVLWLKAESPGASARAVVDTAPLLERGFARLAGLGWIGKNTMLIDRRLGSFTFLGALLTDLELPPDAPHDASHCGTCTRCLDACPTDAFDGPYRLDARRCISYWTIEHKGPLPDEAAESLDGWVFGCDVCQDVCPWNRKAPPGLFHAPSPRSESWEAPDLIEWLGRSKGDWKRAVRGSAAYRAGRIGLLRNAALVLGVERRTEAVPGLTALRDDPSENADVRAAAAWALARIQAPGDHDDEPAAPAKGTVG